MKEYDLTYMYIVFYQECVSKNDTVPYTGMLVVLPGQSLKQYSHSAESDVKHHGPSRPFGFRQNL